MLTDIEIAQQATLIPIDQLAKKIGLKEEEFIPYGRDKAKVETLKANLFLLRQLPECLQVLVRQQLLLP